MTKQPITLTTFSHAQMSAVVDLLFAQELRLCALDPRLRSVRSRQLLAALLARQSSSPNPPLVALDTQGRVRGYVLPAMWDLPEQSILHAFLTARNGIARTMTLADPAQEDAQAVLSALLSALTDSWNEQQTTGELIRWPSCERWLEPVLREQGWLPDSVCALASFPFHAPLRPCPAWLHLRRAEPADEEALVALFLEELQFHAAHTPFVRPSPPVLSAFRAKLARLWAGGSLQEGASLVLVAEQEGQIVAMAQSTLVEVGPDAEPGYTSPGRYGCIDNVCVQEQMRGQGIGRLLTQAAFEAFAALPLTGVLLWYSLDNPLSSAFWPRMGFAPLWTTYQRQSLTHK